MVYTHFTQKMIYTPNEKYNKKYKKNEISTKEGSGVSW